MTINLVLKLFDRIEIFVFSIQYDPDDQDDQDDHNDQGGQYNQDNQDNQDQ